MDMKDKPCHTRHCEPHLGKRHLRRLDRKVAARHAHLLATAKAAMSRKSS